MEPLRSAGREMGPATEAGACKLLVRRAIEEGVNGGHLAVLDEVLDPRVQGVLPDVDSVDELQALLATYREAVPDARWTITEQCAEGDTVVTTFLATGTQTGPLWGLSATGRRMAVAGTLFCTCRDGRIVAERLQLDVLGLMQQLGVMPELALHNEVLVARLVRAGAGPSHRQDIQE